MEYFDSTEIKEGGVLSGNNSKELQAKVDLVTEINELEQKLYQEENNGNSKEHIKKLKEEIEIKKEKYRNSLNLN